MNIDFGVANVARPLISVSKMTSDDHKVHLDDNDCSMFIQGNEKRVELREEGRLLMLALWVNIRNRLFSAEPEEKSHRRVKTATKKIVGGKKRDKKKKKKK